MIFWDLIIIELWLIIFLAFSVWEFNQLNLSGSIKNIASSISQKKILLSLASFCVLIIFSIVSASSLLNAILKIIIGYSILVHAILLSAARKIKHQNIILAIAFAVISYRIFLPSSLSHNLFIIFAISWLAIALVKRNIITKERFIILSVAWFIYDFIYVWLSPLSTVVNSTTGSVGFPLGIVSGDSLMGAADLFWASMFLAIVKKHKTLIAMLLVAVDLVLGIYFLLTTNQTFLPLLVFWIPISGIYFGAKKLIFPKN